jgi:hypothetical protein
MIKIKILIKLLFLLKRKKYKKDDFWIHMLVTLDYNKLYENGFSNTDLSSDD